MIQAMQERLRVHKQHMQALPPLLQTLCPFVSLRSSLSMETVSQGQCVECGFGDSLQKNLPQLPSISPDQGIKPSPSVRNAQASSKVSLANTPPALRLTKNTSLLTMMQEKLQPKLQPPATPENLT